MGKRNQAVAGSIGEESELAAGVRNSIAIYGRCENIRQREQ
jgi:hypothetical protein